MPLGGLIKRGRWFGGLSVAVQELWGPDNRRTRWRAEPLPFTEGIVSGRSQQLLRERTNNNLYITGLFGTDLPDSDLSLAGSAFYGSLNALDGVDLLYPNSRRIDQFGYMADVRFGVLEENADGISRELVFVFNRLSMTHDVYRTAVVTEGQQSSVREVVERNLDRTNTVGAEYTYRHRLGDSWRIAGSLTANRKMHPKIPNYELMNIPRDPGDSWAFNAGLGIAGEADKLTFGVDMIYEPIFSHTWAKAAQPIENDDGEIVVYPGQKTVDNRFQFGNTIFQTGLKREGQWTEFQAGVQIHTIRYWLDQQRFTTGTQRDQYESWSEWTAGLGAGVNLPELSIRYQLRITTGTGRPGTAVSTWGNARESADRMAVSGDFLPAPEGPLTLNGTKVFTHQLSVSVPFNRQ